MRRSRAAHRANSHHNEHGLGPHRGPHMPRATVASARVRIAHA
eukprot:gene46701-55062_t